MFSKTIMKVAARAASLTTPSLDFDGSQYSLHVVVKNSDTLTGSIKVQVSNNNSDWTDHPDFTLALTGDTSAMWRDWAAQYRYLRVVFTRSAGSADLEVVFNSKGGVSNV